MNEARQLVMAVDDNPVNLMISKETLSDTYSVMTVPSASKMFELLVRYTPNLILLDVDMPEINGYEAIKILKDDPKMKNIPVIFLTAMNNSDSELQGLSLGAIDYITKPFSAALLKKRIEVHILVETQKKALQNYNEDLQRMVDIKTRIILKLQNKVLQAMAELVEGRDILTGNHIERTQVCLSVLLSNMFANNIYQEQTKEWNVGLLLQSSLLHDIGKIAIHDNILKKPGKLTKEEFDEMKKHVLYGVSFIERLEESEEDSLFLEYAKIFIKFHHERWDGSGYPNNLIATEVPLLGRLMAIVDVYEALVSARCYKAALDHETAVSVILQGRGTAFEPALIDLFVQCSDQLSLSMSSDRKIDDKSHSLFNIMPIKF
ncbi:MAG: response regulator [Azoarcus sp.]|jgi:putative two-component system response regulator|nr:response regulator [Azoarcus sp.]